MDKETENVATTVFGGACCGAAFNLWLYMHAPKLRALPIIIGALGGGTGAFIGHYISEYQRKRT